MTYTATLTGASLRVRECRIVADLLLRKVTEAEWRQAIDDENVLQLDSQVGAKKLALTLRRRLRSLGEAFWPLVRDGDRELATQAAFACVVKHDRLVADFLDLTLREQRRLFAKQLSNTVWNDFIEGCRGRDPEMPQWSEATVTRLRSAVFAMLAEVGYLGDTRSLAIQTVFVHPRLAFLLRDLGETRALRCLEVTG